MPVNKFEDIFGNIYIKGIGEDIFVTPYPIKIDEMCSIKESDFDDINIQLLLENKKLSEL